MQCRARSYEDTMLESRVAENYTITTMFNESLRGVEDMDRYETTGCADEDVPMS